jgi:hypothetical protein
MLLRRKGTAFGAPATLQAAAQMQAPCPVPCSVHLSPDGQMPIPVLDKDTDPTLVLTAGLPCGEYEKPRVLRPGKPSTRPTGTAGIAVMKTPKNSDRISLPLT